MPYFDDLCAYYGQQVTVGRQKVNKVVGREVDKPTYWQNTQELLFVERGLPLTAEVTPAAAKGGKNTPKCKDCNRGEPCGPKHASTGKDALLELNARHPDAVLPPLIHLKGAEKMKSTYLDGAGDGGFKQWIQIDNRIYANWNAGAAETGRFTCQDPNMMNPPKKVEVMSDEFNVHSKDAIRQMLIAPPGYVIGNIDWAQMEVWVLAYATQDPVLLDLLESGKDVHTYVARKLCALGISSVFPGDHHLPNLSDDEWKRQFTSVRDDAKTFTFGLAYQLTEQGAADRLHCSVEEASLLFQAFLNDVFPTLPNFFANIREEILRFGGTKNRFGRWRHFPEVQVLLALGQGYGHHLEGVIRQGINFPIQSGGHDMHSLAHIAHENNPVLSEIARIVSEMHDSVMFEAREETIEETAWMAKEAWEKIPRETILADGSKLGWKVPVEISWGRSFGELNNTLTADGKIKRAA